MKNDLVYLRHIADCIHRIEKYCRDGEATFLAGELIQDAVLRNLQTLAESAKRISEDFKAAHPEVDWRAIAGFRNVLVHDYLRIDLERIWEIVSVDLPVLRLHVELVLGGADQ